MNNNHKMNFSKASDEIRLNRPGCTLYPEVVGNASNNIN